MSYQLVLQFATGELFDFDALIELETKLTADFNQDHKVDGHDLVAGGVNIFIHTNDPQAAFSWGYGFVPPELRPALKAAYRRQPDGQFHWLYPAGGSGSFNVD